MTASNVELRVVRKGWWLAGARTADHAAVFVVQVLVARVIGPESFGAFAAAMLVLTIVDSATESGLATALVQRDEIEREHLDVAWTLALCRGLLLGGVMLVAAPLVAGIVGSPESTELIRWLAVVPVLRACASPALVTLQRSLAYRRLALATLVESLVLLTVTLALLPVVDGPWALVGGVVGGELARVVASYALAPHRPRSRFERGSAIELLRYGRWVTGSSIALLLLLYLDDVVVAGLMGAAALAVYQLAYQVAGVPASEVSMVVSEVAFTSMARMRSEPDRLRRAFLRSYELVAAIALPIAVALAVMARPLVDLLLGAEWSDAVPVIQVLAAWGVMRALGALTTSLFRAVGRPDIPAKHHWRMVVCTAIALVPMVEWLGLVGAATAVLVPNVVIHWLRYRDVAEVLGTDTDAIVRRLVGPAVAAVAMGATSAAVVAATSGWWPGWQLLVAGGLGLLAYGMSLLVLERSGRCDAIHSARVLTIGATR